MQFDFTAILTAIGGFWAATKGPLATLILAAATSFSGCLSTGCGPLHWTVKKGEWKTGTQFEIGYVSESKVIIGFPGEVKATGSAEGQYEPDPKTAQ